MRGIDRRGTRASAIEGGKIGASTVSVSGLYGTSTQCLTRNLSQGESTNVENLLNGIISRWTVVYK